jgi:hypothetical protein
MFKLFRKNKQDANKKPVTIKPVIKNPVDKRAAYENYTDSELFQALKRKFTSCWFHISKTMITH